MPASCIGQPDSPTLILASGSLARRRLLSNAGLRFASVATGIDEGAVKEAARLLEGSAESTALRLARLKAESVTYPDSVVIGCDQILVCEGAWFDKPASLEAARLHLMRLRGRVHTLVTATVALRAGVQVWQHVAIPRLTMRHATEAFLDAYLAEEGAALLDCVGAYRLEGLGVHLFERIEGEHDAVLGLPLLPLLGFLRSCGVLVS